MPKFAANISMMYGELPFMERFAAAAKDGFKAVEFFFPYDYSPGEMARVLSDNDLQLVLFNATPRSHPDDRGVACLPARETEFRDTFLRALEYAQAMKCPRLHIMSGIVPQGTDRLRLRATYIENLQWAASRAAPHGIDLLIEPINTRDMPGYFLNRQDDAHSIVIDCGVDNVKVQMDLYHCQIVEGDVAMKLKEYLPTGRVGHMQMASVPYRHEPDTGEQNYTYLFDVIDELAYEGWIGAEYFPARGNVPGATTAGLSWMKTLLK